MDWGKALAYGLLALVALVVLQVVVSFVLSLVGLVWTIVTTAVTVAVIVALLYGGYRVVSALRGGDGTSDVDTVGELSDSEFDRQLERELGDPIDDIDRELDRDKE